MANDLSVSIRGLKETQAKLRTIEVGVGEPKLLALLRSAAGQTHRYLMSLGQDHPPVGLTGVLPVRSGRLKNSFYSNAGRMGNSLVGFVRTGLVYARPVEARRGMLARTVKDMERPVNDFFASYVDGLTR